VTEADLGKTYVAASADLMNTRLVTGGTGTQMVVNHFSIWTNISAAVAVMTFPQNFSLNPVYGELMPFQNAHPMFG
jgi:hypothetical protein